MVGGLFTGDSAVRTLQQQISEAASYPVDGVSPSTVGITIAKDGTFSFDDAKEAGYDALVIPGGRAPEYIPLNPPGIEIVKHFAGAKKPIAAICHGAQVLAAAGVLEGRRCSAYPAVGPDVVRAGGKYADIPVDQAVTDGLLVTAPAWPAHPAWLAKFLELLGTRIVP